MYIKSLSSVSKCSESPESPSSSCVQVVPLCLCLSCCTFDSRPFSLSIRLLVVDMRPCVVVGDAYALAELNVFAVEVEVVESPAMGPGARLSRVRFF